MKDFKISSDQVQVIINLLNRYQSYTHEEVNAVINMLFTLVEIKKEGEK